jgi:ornithine cyclodeaminase/alanine dehydrogenase-like protein (mu-crystallin family)
MPPTRLLTRADVTRLIDPLSALPALRAAFIAEPLETASWQRVRSDLPGPGTTTVLFPGVAAGIPAYSVKVHAKFPAEMPAIRGVLLLYDAMSGALLAVMDSTLLTAVRTALAGILAIEVLARPDASRVAIIGAGDQGRWQLRLLREVRRLTAVTVYDVVTDRSRAYAAAMTEMMGVPVRVARSVADAAAEADIIVAATWARTPFLDRTHIRPGTHINTFGADEPGKAECTAALLQASRFICDDRTLAIMMGAPAGVGLSHDVIAGTLGEVLRGEVPGRQSAHEITIFGSVGLPLQDVAVAWQVFQAAEASDTGHLVSFLDAR